MKVNPFNLLEYYIKKEMISKNMSSWRSSYWIVSVSNVHFMVFEFATINDSYHL